MRNIIVLNFKTYRESVGDRALELSMICDDVADETGTEIIIVPQFTDLWRISQSVKIQVYAQHIDPITFGSNTGHILPEAVKMAGVSGSLINHSERMLELWEIEANIKKLRELNLVSILCTNNIEVTRAGAVLNPDFVAIEPPELIGGDVSVTEKPEIITRAVEEVRMINPNVSVLCGAGVKTGEHVKTAIDLGTNGILLASGFVRAKNPRDALMDLVAGL